MVYRRGIPRKLDTFVEADRARRTCHGKLECAKHASDARGLLAHADAGLLKHARGVVQHRRLPGDLLEEHEGEPNEERPHKAPLHDVE